MHSSRRREEGIEALKRLSLLPFKLERALFTPSSMRRRQSLYKYNLCYTDVVPFGKGHDDLFLVNLSHFVACLEADIFSNDPLLKQTKDQDGIQSYHDFLQQAFLHIAKKLREKPKIQASSTKLNISKINTRVFYTLLRPDL